MTTPVVGDADMRMMLWSGCGAEQAGLRARSLLELAVHYSRPQHQLTTGCTCCGIDTGSQFAWISRGCAKHSPELEHLKLQPSRPSLPVRSCCCLYGVRKVEGALGPYALVNMTDRYRRRSWGVWAFKIHPRCPHHGEELHSTMAVFDEWPAWETLDDTERRGD